MRRRGEEVIFRALMLLSLLVVGGSLVGVLVIVLVKGLPTLTLTMLTHAPVAGSDIAGEGGILNAILGSLCLGFGATLLALVLSLPIAFYLQKDYAGRSRLARAASLSLDILWGVPSIVYGAFGMLVMVYLGLGYSLLSGVIALTMVELPIMARAMSEAIRMVPHELKEASYSLGSTRLETMFRVVWRQALPGLVTAVMLAFGRGIGDAAAVLFTTGYTDYLPSSLTEPVASLPLAIFDQHNNVFPEVQERAYASAAVLLAIVLVVSIVSRVLARRLERHVVR